MRGKEKGNTRLDTDEEKKHKDQKRDAEEESKEKRRGDTRLETEEGN